MEDFDVRGGRVLVQGEDRSLMLLDAATGEELGRCRLPGKIRWRPALGDERAFVVVEEEAASGANDLLLALALPGLTPDWEFRDPGFTTRPITDGRRLWITGDDGRARQFR